jgi:hypothetical protein
MMLHLQIAGISLRGLRPFCCVGEAARIELLFLLVVLGVMIIPQQRVVRLAEQGLTNLKGCTHRSCKLSTYLESWVSASGAHEGGVTTLYVEEWGYEYVYGLATKVLSAALFLPQKVLRGRGRNSRLLANVQGIHVDGKAAGRRWSHTHKSVLIYLPTTHTHNVMHLGVATGIEVGVFGVKHVVVTILGMTLVR